MNSTNATALNCYVYGKFPVVRSMQLIRTKPSNISPLVLRNVTIIMYIMRAHQVSVCDPLTNINKHTLLIMLTK